MSDNPPAQCPECGSLAIRVARIPPWKHDRGEEWFTQAECRQCDQYREWFS
ncbi:FmdB family zinc ribbon protein [Halobellus clavatus]|jgi:hypothetical protein|uniref:Small CPxCG-related zinc finger protein n=1 Tax=Halobellus clavatus TaxID=660517 RepID=A0A1H3FQP6_9EURY|nr:hypothetical protein [Halobellus clavatus]SDX92474.1 hypothetical protein SAMN04487946_10475 [Halobellus clavatus]